MDALVALGHGLAVATQWQNLLVCFTGVTIGTFVGVLPGLGPPAALALLLPVSFQLSPTAAIILLAGIYYGSMFGGSTTSILLNVPGEASSVVTTLDGHAMAKKGRAGPALGIAAFGSFIAGTFALLGLVLVAPILARVALAFGSAEFFALTLLAMSLVSFMASTHPSRSMMMAGAGILIGTVGTDPELGVYRFTMGLDELADGMPIIAIIMGLFGVAEVLSSADDRNPLPPAKTPPLRKLLPNARDWGYSGWAILRGTVLGFLLGMLPGGSPILGSFAAYAVEKRVSKRPEAFGQGAIEGVAGPESANNSAASAAFIPLLTVGIPTTPVMALMLGGLMIHGIVPGPVMIQQHPDIFWGLVASMYVGNALLLILNLPLIGMWVRLLNVRYSFMFPGIIVASIVGVYGVRNSMFDVGVMLVFAVAGYIAKKRGYEPAPLVLGLILGPLMEENLRRSLDLFGGDPLKVMTERPFSAVMLVAAIAVILLAVFRDRGVRVTR